MDPSQKGKIGRRYRLSLKKEEQVKDMEFLQKGRTIQIHGLSLERRNMSKIWNLLGKEEQIEDMNPPRTMGE